MTTLAAIRTHKWTDDERRLLDVLQASFGDNVAVVFHNTPADLHIPVPVVAIDDAWVNGQGLRVLPDWGWRCGDYFHYALAAARPEAEFCWLVEPDVLFRGDARQFFDAVATNDADAIGARFGPADAKNMFLRGVGAHPPMLAYFPVTRLSARATRYLFGERQIYSQSAISDRLFTNDELFVFSWLAANPDMTCTALESIVPDWFHNVHFLTNPDILLEAALTRDIGPHGIFHPVRSSESFCREVARRIVGTSRFRNMLQPSGAALTRHHADLIAQGIRAELTEVFERDSGTENKSGPA